MNGDRWELIDERLELNVEREFLRVFQVERDRCVSPHADPLGAKAISPGLWRANGVGSLLVGKRSSNGRTWIVVVREGDQHSGERQSRVLLLHDPANGLRRTCEWSEDEKHQ